MLFPNFLNISLRYASKAHHPIRKWDKKVKDILAKIESKTVPTYTNVEYTPVEREYNDKLVKLMDKHRLVKSSYLLDQSFMEDINSKLPSHEKWQCVWRYFIKTPEALIGSNPCALLENLEYPPELPDSKVIQLLLQYKTHWDGEKWRNQKLSSKNFYRLKIELIREGYKFPLEPMEDYSFSRWYPHGAKSLRYRHVLNATSEENRAKWKFLMKQYDEFIAASKKIDDEIHQIIKDCVKNQAERVGYEEIEYTQITEVNPKVKKLLFQKLQEYFRLPDSIKALEALSAMQCADPLIKKAISDDLHSKSQMYLNLAGIEVADSSTKSSGKKKKKGVSV